MPIAFRAVRPRRMPSYPSTTANFSLKLQVPVFKRAVIISSQSGAPFVWTLPT